MLFNIYYINFPKVYEIKMMLSNIISTDMEYQMSKSSESNEKLDAKIGVQFLKFFSAGVGAEQIKMGSDSEKVLETFKIKMTKSTVLNEVLEKSTKVENFDTKITEGKLVRVENVNLTLENETELRTVKLFSNGTFKGMKIPEAGGLDINNMFNSIFKDYSYKLKGKLRDKGGILIKIPMTFENEFENLYSVDDLFIGKVTVVGIYKGKTKIESLKNSFQFFQELGDTTSNGGDDFQEIHESQCEKQGKGIQFVSSNDGEDYDYIDVLAIIQQINFDEESVDSDDE